MSRSQHQKPLNYKGIKSDLIQVFQITNVLSRFILVLFYFRCVKKFHSECYSSFFCSGEFSSFDEYLMLQFLWNHPFLLIFHSWETMIHCFRMKINHRYYSTSVAFLKHLNQEFVFFIYCCFSPSFYRTRKKKSFEKNQVWTNFLRKKLSRNW